MKLTTETLVIHEVTHLVVECAMCVLACREPPITFSAVVAGTEGVATCNPNAFNCAVTVIVENHRARLEGITLADTCVSPEDIEMGQTLSPDLRAAAMRLGAWLAYSGTVKHVAGDLKDDSGMIAVNGEKLFKAIRPTVRRIANPNMENETAARVPKPPNLPIAYVEHPLTPDQLEHVRVFLANTSPPANRGLMN